jgi:hypothetical protein
MDLHALGDLDEGVVNRVQVRIDGLGLILVGKSLTELQVFHSDRIHYISKVEIDMILPSELRHTTGEDSGAEPVWPPVGIRIREKGSLRSLVVLSSRSVLDNVCSIKLPTGQFHGCRRLGA